MVYTYFEDHHIKHGMNDSLNPLSEKQNIHLFTSEIVSTAKIENITFDERIVEKILGNDGQTMMDSSQIYAMKKGYDFIQDGHHHLDQTNLYHLYQISIYDSLDANDQPRNGSMYRDDVVHVVDSYQSIHAGVNHTQIIQYMDDLFRFINDNSNNIDDLTKAIIIHFYIGYVHPWFDGNGRMARLAHLWYLIQKGYAFNALLPFSESILSTRKLYYKAYQLVETNRYYGQTIDIAPFIDYFYCNVYNHCFLNH